LEGKKLYISKINNGYFKRLMMSLNTLGTKQTSVVNVGIKESHKKKSREDYINIILSKAKKIGW
jgi:hypothetical protein